MRQSKKAKKNQKTNFLGSQLKIGCPYKKLDENRL